MLISRFRKKNASSATLAKQPAAKDKDPLELASFQSYPLLSSRLDHPHFSLGHRRPILVSQSPRQLPPFNSREPCSSSPLPQHYPQRDRDASRSTNSSTVSFNSRDAPALSNSLPTSSSPSSLPASANSSLSSPTLTNQSLTPPQERHLNHPTPKSLRPSNSSTPRPAPATTTTTTANPTVQFAKLAADDGDDPTVVIPTDSPSPTHHHFDRPHQNKALAQSVPPVKRHPSPGAFCSDATQQNQHLQAQINQVPIRPRAFSQHAPVSPNQAGFPTNHSKKSVSLFAADPLELVPPFHQQQPRLPHQSIDSASARSSKKIGRRHLRRSKTDHSKPASGIATALAFSGVSLTPHSTSVGLAGTMQRASSSTIGSTRSPEENDNRSVHTNDSRHWTHSSHNDDQLGTGYAVASSKRNAEFHSIFKSIPDDDYLVEDYGCALQRDILVQGRIYISEQHLCFKANIFGWVTTLVVPFSDVAAIEKRMTALIIPNAIQVITTQSRHTFASFLTRDTAYDMMVTLWHNAHPPGASPPFALHHDGTNLPSGASGDGVQVEYQDPSSTLSLSSSSLPPKKREHPVTQCGCSPETHCKEVIWDATYPISPEKLYNILFQSDFLKDFWVNEEHLTEIEVGDWTTAPDAKFPSRNLSYVRPLNAPVGPKTIKCLLSDEHLALDFDKYVSIMSTTVTPDAPAGGGFCVKTLTCITWQPNNSSRWLVTAGVEWTKVNRFLKGIIESSAISGQKTYQAAVDRALRNHIQVSHVEPNLDRSEMQASLVGVNSDEGLRNGNETKNAHGSGRNEVKSKRGYTPTSSNNTISKIQQVISSGTQSSWTMMASIALAVVLLVANLMTVNRGDRVVISGIRQVPFQGQDSKYPAVAGQSVKPQLTGDVAETVREALQQYFSDHSSSSSSTASSRTNSEPSTLFTTVEKLSSSEEMTQDQTTPSSATNQKEKSSFAKEEIAEIESLLESLEQRIRNVRKSLVDQRRH